MKGTWPQAIFTFLLPIILIFVVRWAVFEPFVIPSGSMIPSLLIHDHLIVKKYSFGLHIPFMDQWLVRWSQPQRGQIIVFKYPENPELYYIKRLIGLPGDVVKVRGHHIEVNGQSWTMNPAAPAPDMDSADFDYFIEQSPDHPHFVRLYKKNSDTKSDATNLEEKTYQVPIGHYFFMGDNREQSSDSRYWGFVPEKYLVGTASFIWLSCEKMLSSAPYLCQPDQIRPERIFQTIQ